jgi:hypothetical protein
VIVLWLFFGLLKKGRKGFFTQKYIYLVGAELSYYSIVYGSSIQDGNFPF